MTKIVYLLNNKKKLIVEEKFYEFRNLKEKNNPNNLIHKYKTEGSSPKAFSYYQNPLDPFRDL